MIIVKMSDGTQVQLNDPHCHSREDWSTPPAVFEFINALGNRSLLGSDAVRHQRNVWETQAGLKYLQDNQDSEDEWEHDMIRNAKNAHMQELERQNHVLLARSNELEQENARLKQEVARIDPSQNDAIDVTNAGFVMVSDEYWRAHHHALANFYSLILSIGACGSIGIAVLLFVGASQAELALFGCFICCFAAFAPSIAGIRKFLRKRPGS